MSFFKDFKTTSDVENQRKILEKQLEFSRITREFEAGVAALVSGIPLAERESWPKQEMEARNYIIDPTASTPYLSQLAQVRNEPIAELVDKVLVKVTLFEQQHAILLGTYHMKVKALEAL